ncbi:hypothetical protein BACPU_32890 [Bacillus pumilus]|nr:hypothetical protein BACPU_32890 [Bacillus pumilus]
MIKKCSILLFASFLLAGCGGQTENTEKTANTVTEKPATEKDKKTVSQDKITVEPMKLTANEKSLLEALTDESFKAMTVKGLKASYKSVSLIGMHYKDGQLLKDDTKDATIQLHQNGVDKRVNFIYQIDDEIDHLLKATYTLWVDKEKSELTKLSTSVDFKQDVGGSISIMREEPLHITPGEKKLIYITITSGPKTTTPGLTGFEKNPEKTLKNVKHAYLLYVQLNK